QHEARYSYSSPHQEPVIVNARLAVVAALPAPPEEQLPTRADINRPKGQRRTWVGNWEQLPVYSIDALVPGSPIIGPAIFESDTTTVLLRKKDEVHITPHGWLDIRLAGK